VSLAREGSGSGGGTPPLSSKPEPDVDTAEAMGCFASPKRLGHHGSISDVCVLSYEPINVSRTYPNLRLCNAIIIFYSTH